MLKSLRRELPNFLLDPKAEYLGIREIANNSRAGRGILNFRASRTGVQAGALIIPSVPSGKHSGEAFRNASCERGLEARRGLAVR